MGKLSPEQKVILNGFVYMNRDKIKEQVLAIVREHLPSMVREEIAGFGASKITDEDVSEYLLECLAGILPGYNPCPYIV